MGLLQKIINIISEDSSNKEEVLVEKTAVEKAVEEPKKVEIKRKYVLPPVSLIDEQNSPNFLKGLKSEPLPKLSFRMKKYGSNEYETISISEMPNLLIGGTLMSGKTSLINSIICSLLMTTKPDEVKFVLVDTKRIELSAYEGIPYLLAPIQSDYMRVQTMLKRLVGEMERRYDLLRETKNRNIEIYNSGIENYNKNVSEEDKLALMPYIVVIIDEFTPITSDNNIDLIEKLSLMGYSVGIHIILVANHPASTVISRLVQANFSSRISFRTVSKQDSRMIIDDNGAEVLETPGVCLYKGLKNTKPIKLEVPFVDDETIKLLSAYACNQQRSMYDDNLLEENKNYVSELDDGYVEPLYDEIVNFVVSQGKASASLLQRRFRLGYNRAARCIDLLEERGIIGPQNGSKPREVLKKD